MYIRILLSLALAGLVSATTPDTFAQQLLYIHADHLNTPRLVTNGAGVAVWRWDQTEPFGDNVPNEDPDGNGTPGHMPLRFPGQYFDKETNLHYNYFRDYDPGIGKYIQSDPVTLRDHVLNALSDQQALRHGAPQYANGVPPAQLNPYSYVAAAPLRWQDPKGDAIAIPAICLITPANAAACAAAAAAAASAAIELVRMCLNYDKDKADECYEKCKHLLPSPSGDLQSSEYRKCYRECTGSL